jgi:hypothetical protein
MMNEDFSSPGTGQGPEKEQRRHDAADFHNKHHGFLTRCRGFSFKKASMMVCRRFRLSEVKMISPLRS